MTKRQKLWLAVSYLVVVLCFAFGAVEWVQTHAIIVWDEYDGLQVYKTYSHDRTYMRWFFPAGLWLLYAAVWLPYYYSHKE